MRSASILVVVLGLGACGASTPSLRARPAGDPLAAVPPATLFQQGQTLAAAGDLVRAEQYLAAAGARGYPQEKVVPELLDVCLKSSRFQAALGYARPYLSRHPEAWPLRFLVASLYRALGDPDRARTHLEQILVQVPGQPDSVFLLASILGDDLGQRTRARKLYHRYLDLAPRGPHAGEAKAALAMTERGRR